MLSYCLKCRKQKVKSQKNRKIMFLSKCEVCDSKKLTFIKEGEAAGLLTSLTKINLFGPLFFNSFPEVNTRHKMSKVAIKLFLAGDFMPEMDLRQPEFTYSACGPFVKSKERMQTFEEREDSQYIYQNE